MQWLLEHGGLEYSRAKNGSTMMLCARQELRQQQAKNTSLMPLFSSSSSSFSSSAFFAFFVSFSFLFSFFYFYWGGACSEANRLPLLKWLISSGRAKIKEVNNNKMGALHFAVTEGHLQVIDAFLSPSSAMFLFWSELFF